MTKINEPLDFSEGMRLYVALVHYPILNRRGDVVTSAVTNINIHDLSRSARTFGVKRIFMITPIQEQAELLRHIQDVWNTNEGQLHETRRAEALSRLCVEASLQNAISSVTKLEGQRPVVVATSAVDGMKDSSFNEISTLISKNENAVLLMFGTGWGLAPEVLELADFKLEPITGYDEYNHLSVRAAFAIIVDRLVGRSVSANVAEA
jgi:hypothetical protein